MLEGYIASKFANKYFEDSIFRIVKKHAIVVAILSLIPDLGIVYILGLWRMYVKIANKCDISFKDNFKSLIGTGMVVNVIIYFIADTLLTFIPFANPIIAYFLFYLSGKMYVESVKLLPLPKDENLHLKNLAEDEKYEQCQNSENKNDLYYKTSNLYCPSCGKEVEYGSMFCPFCGAKIEFEQTVNKSETLSDNQNDNYKEGRTNESATSSTIKNNKTDKSLIIVAIAVLTIVAGVISFRAIQTHRIKKMIEAEIEATEMNETVEEACEDDTVSLERVIELFESIPDHEQVSSSSRSAMTADLYNTLLIAWDVPDCAKYISMIGDNEFLYYFVNGQDPSPIKKFDETTIINSNYKNETHCTLEIGFFYERYDERQKILLYLVKEQGRWMLDDFSSTYSDKEFDEYFVESQKGKCSKYINTSIKDWINGIPQNQILKYADSDYDKVKKFNSEFDTFFKTYPSMKEFADNIKKSSKADWKMTEYGFKVPNNMVSNDYIWVDDALGEYMSWTNGDVQLLLWPGLPSWSVEEGFPSNDTYLSSNVKVKSITYSNSTKDVFSGYASDGRIWYLKKIFLKGDVTWRTDCLFLLYPKSEQKNVRELIDEVKNWDGR